MHTILWTRSPLRTTWIAWRHWHQGRREWRNPPLRQCLPGSRGANPARHAEDAPCHSGLARWRRDTPSCPAHVRAVDAPVCSVAAHAAGPHVVIAKTPAAVLASNMFGIYALQAMGEETPMHIRGPSRGCYRPAPPWPATVDRPSQMLGQSFA